MGASSLLLQTDFTCLETVVAVLVLKIPVFSNSKALEVSCAGQTYSFKDDLQKKMKEPFWRKKEPAVCTRTTSTVQSCDR